MDEEELLNNPKIQAMLKVIRTAEGADYNTRVGGERFSDLSKKPGQKVYIPSIKDYSSAEGAYQFLNKTWDGISKKLGLKDFSPRSQDLAAIGLIKQRGALNDILNNKFETAINKLSGEWASLPKATGGSVYRGQKARKMDYLKSVWDMPINESEKIIEDEPVVNSYANIDEKLPIVVGQVFNTEEQQKETKEETASKKLLEESFQEEQQMFQQQMQNTVTQEQQYQEAPLLYQVDLQPIEYTPITEFQEGGTYSKEDEDFIKNWYQGRTTVLDEQGNVIEVPKYNFNFNPVTKISEDLPQSTYGEFNPSSKEVLLSPNYQSFPGILPHEINHYIQDQLSAKDTVKFISDPIYKNISEETESKVKNLGAQGNYLLDPSEVHSRLMQFRQFNKYKPNEIIDPEKLKNSKNKELFKLDMFNDEQLLNLLNKTVSVENKPKEFIAKNGGQIPISSRGMYDYPNQIVQVPTDGSITMKNINYPILGTSLETLETKLMLPNNKYFFKNTNSILESPASDI